MRSSAYMLAIFYVALGLVTLALFAAPLWYAWRVTIEEGRTEILQEDAERFAARMLTVDQKTVRWEKRRIDVKRDGEKYVTLFSTEDLPERVIEVSSSLPGALGSAYQRVDEMLAGYTAIPIHGSTPVPARNGGTAPAAKSGGTVAGNGNAAGRRRRGRRSRSRQS